MPKLNKSGLHVGIEFNRFLYSFSDKGNFIKVLFSFQNFPQLPITSIFRH
jgi:hypothetical protein